MEWKSQTFGDWKKQVSEWHTFFAWHPVFCLKERKTVWLQTVERKLLHYYNYTGSADWSYRTLKKVI